ncbi:MAG: VOC family protein [Gemmatimonadales bacterium]
MTVMETYAPGTFCWADLGTPDARAAKRFYTDLFGWQAEDRPAGADSYYTMFSVGGRWVAALYQQDAQPDQALSPHWLSYLSVEAAGPTAQRVRELGGTVVDEAFDVLDVGRMAVIRDPTGAVVALWEPRRHVGAGVVGEPGAPCWNELVTSDPDCAVAFYAGLLAWQCESHPMGGSTYTYCRRGETLTGGMRPIDIMDGSAMPHWLLYFSVDDCETASANAVSLGGKVVQPPTDVPEVGRFAILQDPQGAVFAVVRLPPAGSLHPG